MEGSKPLPWLALAGCVLIMVSLIAAFGVYAFLSEPGGTFKAPPLANLAGIVLLLLGIVLIYVGFRKAE